MRDEGKTEGKRKVRRKGRLLLWHSISQGHFCPCFFFILPPSAFILALHPSSLIPHPFLHPSSLILHPFLVACRESNVLISSQY